MRKTQCQTGPSSYSGLLQMLLYRIHSPQPDVPDIVQVISYLHSVGKAEWMLRLHHLTWNEPLPGLCVCISTLGLSNVFSNGLDYISVFRSSVLRVIYEHYFLIIKKFILFYKLCGNLCVCVAMCMWAWVPLETRVIKPQELELLVGLSTCSGCWNLGWMQFLLCLSTASLEISDLLLTHFTSYWCAPPPVFYILKYIFFYL